MSEKRICNYCGEEYKYYESYPPAYVCGNDDCPKMGLWLSPREFMDNPWKAVQDDQPTDSGVGAKIRGGPTGQGESKPAIDTDTEKVWPYTIDLSKFDTLLSDAESEGFESKCFIIECLQKCLIKPEPPTTEDVVKERFVLFDVESFYSILSDAESCGFEDANEVRKWVEKYIVKEKEVSEPVRSQAVKEVKSMSKKHCVEIETLAIGMCNENSIKKRREIRDEIISISRELQEDPAIDTDEEGA